MGYRVKQTARKSTGSPPRWVATQSKLKHVGEQSNAQAKPKPKPRVKKVRPLYEKPTVVTRSSSRSNNQNNKKDEGDKQDANPGSEDNARRE